VFQAECAALCTTTSATARAEKTSLLQFCEAPLAAAIFQSLGAR
jgi:hypothetical protein